MLAAFDRQCCAQRLDDVERLMVIQRRAVLHAFPFAYTPAAVAAFLAQIVPARFALGGQQPMRWLAWHGDAVLGDASWWADGRVAGVYVCGTSPQRGVGTRLMAQIEALAACLHDGWRRLCRRWRFIAPRVLSSMRCKRTDCPTHRR